MKQIQAWIILCVFSVFVQVTEAKESIGKVKMVKGKVTILFPGAQKAVMAKKGQSVYEDTSIVTGASSVIRIEYTNGASITLGPEGKYIVEEVIKQKNDATLVTLLKGKLRAKVEKGLTNKNKLILKTRTAALGIRGTEFYTVYNPENQVTSLVTFDGEVAMKKYVKKRGIVDQKDAASHIKHSGSKLEALETALDESDTVLVKKGRYSGVNSNFLKATKPVKIAPVQYVALVKNENLETAEMKKPGELKPPTKEEIKQAAKEIAKVQVDDPDHEGEFDAKKGEYAPKSGGYLDPETGIYVQPDKNADFDKDLGVFKADEKIGKLDGTGAYVAPEGLELTASSGFIAATKEDRKKKDKLLASLNENVATAIPIAEKEEKAMEKKVEEIAKKSVETDSLIRKHRFNLYVGPVLDYVSEFDGFNTLMFNDGDRNVMSDSGGDIYLQYRAWWRGFETEFDIQRTSITWENTTQNSTYDGDFAESEELISLSAKIRYWIWSWFGVHAGLKLQDNIFPRVVDVDGGNGLIVPYVYQHPRFMAGFDFRFINAESFKLRLSTTLQLLSDTEIDIESPTGTPGEAFETTGGGGNQLQITGRLECLEKLLSQFLPGSSDGRYKLPSL